MKLKVVYVKVVVRAEEAKRIKEELVREASTVGLTDAVGHIRKLNEIDESEFDIPALREELRNQED